MIEGFREWLSSILVLSIIFLLVKIIMPSNNMKKYVYTVMGIITILTIFSPIVNIIQKDNSEETLSKIVLDLADRKVVNMDYMNFENMEENTINTIKEKFKDNLSQDIKKKIKDKYNIEASVKVEVSQAYNIENILVNVESNETVEIETYIATLYDIPKEKISINNTSLGYGG